MQRRIIHSPVAIPTPAIHISKDGLMCRADRPLIPHIAEVMRYSRELARPGQFGTKMKRQDAYFIDRRNGAFLYGLLKRAVNHLTAKGVKFSVEDTGHIDYPRGPLVEPSLRGITLRSEQLNLINIIRQDMRGVIVAPTGSGKTITTLGALSMWPQARALITVHRKDIAKDQFYTRAMQHFIHNDIQLVMGGQGLPNLTGQLVIGIINTISKYPVSEILKFDIVAADECHHVADRKSMYGRLFQNNIAPVKIGFTATVPPETERLLAMEGLIGPVIGELTHEESRAMGIIADAYVTLVPVPYSHDIGDLKKYRDIYDAGIVNNQVRNARIIKLARDRAARGRTSLTIIREVKHGNNLMEISAKFRFPTKFVHGASDIAAREYIKGLLNEGQVPHVICTDVWREGVDIPTLGTVIMAGSGKSELQTIQGVGRGLRTADGKDMLEIIDFMDPYRYLARHFVKRLTIYTEKGWLKCRR